MDLSRQLDHQKNVTQLAHPSTLCIEHLQLQSQLQLQVVLSCAMKPVLLRLPESDHQLKHLVSLLLPQIPEVSLLMTSMAD